MVRWIAIAAAIALAAGTAYGQSAPQTQPMLPLGQGQTMGGHMNSPMMGGNAELQHGMMSMMQMMHMMESGMMGPGTQDAGMMMGQDMGGPMCRGHMAMMHAAGMEGSPASHLEARLAFTKAELAITAAQDAGWQAYAAALRSQVQPAAMATRHHAMMTGAAFPARFDARITMLEEQLTDLKAVRDAAVALYGSLDDGQKTKADALLPMSLCF